MLSIVEPDPAFGEYIAACTYGVVSADGLIRLELVNPPADSAQRSLWLRKKLFAFEPALKGKTEWLDGRTIAFRPEGGLRFNQIYKGRFYLGEVQEVPSRFRVFTFGFRTLPCYVEPEFLGFSSEDGRSQALFRVQTSERVNPEQILPFFSARQTEGTLRVRALTDKPGREHKVVLEDFDRHQSADLEVRVKASEKGFVGEKQFLIDLPQPGSFTLTRQAFYGMREGRITLNFSEPPDPSQSLEPLFWVSIQDRPLPRPEGDDERGLSSPQDPNLSLRPEVDGHNVYLYPDEWLSQKNWQLHISPKLRSVQGTLLGREEVLSLDPHQMKPSLQLECRGSLVPSYGQALLPFRASLLKSVNVLVFQIPDPSVEFCLSGNNYSLQEAFDHYEISRYCRLVWEGKVHLSGAPYPEQLFALDLSALLPRVGGKFFILSLYFRPEDAFLNCAGDSPIPMEGTTPPGMKVLAMDLLKKMEDDYSGYRSMEDAWYYDAPDFSWSKIHDPCNPAFYVNKGQSALLFVTDLAVIAKASGDGQLSVAVSSLARAQGLGGVRVTVMDRMRTPLATATTGAHGIARFSKLKEGRPEFIKAEAHGQVVWLPLQEYEALDILPPIDSYSALWGGRGAFPGFVYTDRGVWRPGDTIFTATVLQGESDILKNELPLVYELTDSRGQLVDRQVRNAHKQQILVVPFVTSPEAPTGSYTLKVKSGPFTYTRTLLVEAIKPNRMVIQVHWPAKVLRPSTASSIPLEVNWLSGAPARNMKVTQSVQLAQAEPSFPNFKQYQFSPPPWTLKETEERTVWEGFTNEEGKANASWNLKLSKAAGMLEATVTTQVWEPGGYSSIDVQKLQWSPFETYVGFTVNGSPSPGILKAGKTYLLRTVVVDALGKRIQDSETIRITLAHQEPRAWLESDIHVEDGYVASVARDVVWDTTFTTGPGGESKVWFSVPELEEGSFEMRVSSQTSGYTSAMEFYVADEEGVAYEEVPGEGRAYSLSLQLDRKECAEGESVSLSFPSAGNETALISLETSERLLSLERIACRAGTTTHRLQIPEGAAPNAFVQVMLIKPYNGTTRSQMLRTYAIAELKVRRPDSRLWPVVRVDSPVEPDLPFELTVQERQGRPCLYTLAIVDEGLLGLTRFKTPDVYEAMYRARPYGGKTWDLYDEVLTWSSVGKARPVKVGGDGHLDISKAGRLTRFKPVVKFLGPFRLRAGQKARHRVLIENYAGAVRVMVVAAAGQSYGSADTTLPVTRDVMLMPTLPRVLAPGEEVDLPVNVLCQGSRDVQVQLTVHPGSILKLRESGTRSLRLKKKSEETVIFPLRCGRTEGWTEVTIVATGAGRPVKATIPIQIRNPERPRTLVEPFAVEPGQSATPRPPAEGFSVKEAWLEVYSRLRLNLSGVLNYLVNYPYGCAEQVTSAAFPQLYLPALTSLNSEQSATVNRQVRRAISRLSAYQAPDGGMAYWPGGRQSEAWVSAYALHFLYEAARLDYPVPEGLLRRLKNYVQGVVNRYRGSAVRSPLQARLTQAYCLYVLAAANMPAQGAMHRFLEEAGQTPETSWYLAAAYALSGRQELASRLAFRQKPADESAYLYGSPMRSQALALMVLSLLKREKEATELARKLAEDLEQGYFNTQGASFALQAFSQYYQHFPVQTPPIFRLGNEEPITLTKPLYRRALKPGLTPLVANLGKESLKGAVVFTGQPAMGSVPDRAQGLTLATRFLDEEGRPLAADKLPQTAQFVVEWTVGNTTPGRDLRHVALCQMLPSGWEVQNTAALAGNTSESGAVYEYRDVRDDRVCFFFSLSAGQSKTFRVRVQASYAGRFYLPGALAEDMYQPQISASRAGRWIEVVRSGGTPAVM